MSQLFLASPTLRAVLVAGAIAAPLVSLSRPAAPTAKPRVLTVVASEYSFELPASVPAGLTTIRLVNKGKELHHMVLVRFDEGKSLDDLFAAMKQGADGPPPSWLHEVPSPNAVGPNGETSVTVALQPGNYAVLCFIPAADHAPHVAKGMAKPFKVTPAYGAKTAALPKADVTMTLVDYDFALSKPLKAGKHVIRVKNGASQPHEVQLVRLDPGKTPADVTAWVDKQEGPPPGLPLGGVVGVAPGTQANWPVTLEKGEYALICFIGDAKDGKPHFAHGMSKQITVN